MSKTTSLFLAIFLAATILLGLLVVVKGVPLKENLFIHSGPETYSLYGGNWVEQKFVPTRQKLIGLELPFKKTNDVDHPVKVTLIERIDEKHSRLLYQATFSSKAVVSNRGYTFWLDEPWEKPDQSVWLQLTASAATSSASVSPIISRVDNYLAGETVSSEGPLDGDIMFRPIYKVPVHRFVGYYLNRIAFGKPVLYHKFGLLLGLSLGLGITGLVWVFVGRLVFRSYHQWWLALGVGALLVVISAILYFETQPVFWLRRI